MISPRILHALLNDTLEDVFRPRYPGFRFANGDQALSVAA